MLLEIFLWVREYPLVHIFDVDIMELHIVVDVSGSSRNGRGHDSEI